MLSLLTGREKLLPRPKFSDIYRGFIGGSLSIFILLLLGHWTQNPIIMASFGASCVLLYAAPYSPLAQPRNILFGHLLCATVGMVTLKLFGAQMWSIALAVGVASALMQLLRCVHPPAGANPLIILLSADALDYPWHFLIFPVATGAIALILIAWCVNNIASQQKWPFYGLGLWQNGSAQPRSAEQVRGKNN